MHLVIPDADLDARWQAAAGRYDDLATVSARALIDCVAEDLRLTEGSVYTDHIVEYKTARALQLVAERDLVALVKALAADAIEPARRSPARPLL
jgi:hypothetical protein